MLVLLMLNTAVADTWSSSVGALISGSPDIAWLEVQAPGQLRVAKLLRGKSPDPHPWMLDPAVPVGTRVLSLCGHPHAATCVRAVERDGVFWFEQADLGFDTMGHVPPGLSTLPHLQAMLAGTLPPDLCVRIGAKTARVSPATGAAGLDSSDPIGVTDGAGTIRIDHFDAAAPVHVGRAGHTTVTGRHPRLVGDCVQFELVR